MTQAMSSGARRALPAMVAGALAGLALWALFDAMKAGLPIWLRLMLAVTVLIFGPGAGLMARLLAPVAPLSRVVLGFSFGVAFAPSLAHGLGSLGLLSFYPYLAATLLGGALGYWRQRGAEAPRATRASYAAPLVLVLLAVGVGGTAFANRLTTVDGRTAVYGEYDTYDLTYYAAIAAELSHTVPPSSPFYAGRLLNHSFYPHLAIALVHRFGDVPLLDLYFRFAWPGFLLLAVLGCYVFVESISDRRTALISAILVGFGSDLSYAAGWFFTTSNWDGMIWSHNFQGAGAEVLLYNNWAPALVIWFAGLYALRAWLATSGPGWAVAAGVSFAVTILSKPWIFATVVCALAVTSVVFWRDRPRRRHLLVVLGVTVAAALPYIYRTTTLFDDAQVVFAPAFFPIPLVMASRLSLEDSFLTLAGQFGVTGATQEGLAGLLALPLFLIAGLGFRLAGLATFWRSLRRPRVQDPIWSVLAWTVVAAFGASSFIVSVPYHETTQIHQFSLFLLGLFVGRTLGTWPNATARLLVTAALVGVAIPSTVHYVHRKWTDTAHPFADVGPEEKQLVSLLRHTDPAQTVLLHNRPTRSNLLTILAERRSVLSWGDYVRNSDSRREDVDAFFTSAGEPPDRALAVLQSYRPTHVIEYRRRDQINAVVRDQLEFVFSNPDVTLYRVPSRLRGGSPP